MKCKKIAGLIGTVALLAAIGIGATLAYFTDKETATNEFAMGKIDIEVNESQIEDIIMPGDVIDKSPTITVKEDSEEAYIRAKVTYKCDGKELESKEIKELKAKITWKSDWVKSLKEENVWYYQKPVSKDSNNIVLFDQVKIPESWGNKMAGKTLEIEIEADAIQTKNFKPDKIFGKIIGWKGITPEEYPVKK